MRFQMTVFSERDGVSFVALDAANQAAAIADAKRRGLAVLSVRPTRGLLAGLTRRRSAFPVLQVSQELLALMRAGVSLVEAFETLAEKEQAEDTRSVLNRILGELRSGKTLSAALESFDGVFPPLYVASVRASERTGGLIESLSRYVAYRLQLEGVKKKIVSALVYPILLASVGGVVTIFLLTYVVPRFSKIFEDRGGDLPLMTKLLIQWGSFFDAHAWQALIGAVSALGCAAFLLSRAGFIAAAYRLARRIPKIGGRVRLFQLARMYRTLGMLLLGGMPVVSALGMIRSLMEPSMWSQFDLATRRIREGMPISSAMVQGGLTTPVAVRMLRVGEQTGGMGEMMERIAELYDDENARALEIFSRVFEPLLMATIGLIIGSIVVLMYLPIFELAANIQ